MLSCDLRWFSSIFASKICAIVTSIMMQCFKRSPAMPVSYTSISSSLDDHLLIPSPAGGAGEAAGVGACVWVPATHKGHSDGVSGFWLWPEILRSCGDWNRDGRFLSFFPPSLFITLPLRWIHVSLEACGNSRFPPFDYMWWGPQKCRVGWEELSYAFPYFMHPLWFESG